MEYNNKFSTKNTRSSYLLFSQQPKIGSQEKENGVVWLQNNTICTQFKLFLEFCISRGCL